MCVMDPFEIKIWGFTTKNRRRKLKNGRRWESFLAYPLTAVCMERVEYFKLRLSLVYCYSRISYLMAHVFKIQLSSSVGLEDNNNKNITHLRIILAFPNRQRLFRQNAVAIYRIQNVSFQISLVILCIYFDVWVTTATKVLRKYPGSLAEPILIFLYIRFVNIQYKPLMWYLLWFLMRVIKMDYDYLYNNKGVCFYLFWIMFVSHSLILLRTLSIRMKRRYFFHNISWHSAKMWHTVDIESDSLNQ